MAYAEHFTSTWSAALTTPNPSNTYGYMALYGVSCTGATCETVGEADPNSGGEQPLAELLNGSTWKYQPLPNSYYQDPFGNALSGVSCTAANACTAAGSTGYASTIAYRFTGSWAVQGTPPFSPDLAAGRLFGGVVRSGDRLHRGRDVRRRGLDQVGRMGEPDARAPAESPVGGLRERRRRVVHGG